MNADRNPRSAVGWWGGELGRGYANGHKRLKNVSQKYRSVAGVSDLEFPTFVCIFRLFGLVLGTLRDRVTRTLDRYTHARVLETAAI